ncbi:hypothetical protein VTJ49DRAFT_781 [Mycothermus thermophilus]|uniref:TFIIS N-terminal domain-containing protein n=1 Tax=Humicola insolens TaxID=85995 RepID=A0ABR3VE75_HUMIN
MSDANSPAGSRAGSAEPAEQHDNDRHDSPEETHDADAGNASDLDKDNDKDSDLLSEIDEDQFEDYDPTREERPVEIDESVAMNLKAARRKRTEGETVKKPKEGRRPKKRSRQADEEGADTAEDERRPRKARSSGGERRSAKKDTQEEEEEVNEENLTPEERRRRAIQRAMDDALKNPTKRRRKKDEIDLEDEIDEQIANLKLAMENACRADNEARQAGQPATNKLKLLPQVTAMLTRTAVQEAVLDPDTNFIQSVKFFLEPLNDGSLPAYSIQRDLFNALTKLPINKDVLLSSGIGKLVYFYTLSKQPEPSIKRLAERLIGEWSRPILKRTDDYRKRQIETREIDIIAAKMAQRQEAAAIAESSLQTMTLTQRPAGGKTRFELERERALAPEIRKANRALPAGLPATYTIAPRSTFDPSRAASEFRPVGSAGLEAFRKMTSKGKGAGKRS